MVEQPFFKAIERKTGVAFEELLVLAQAIQHADFSNERQVRKIVRKVAKVANKPVSTSLEDQIVQSIIKDGKSLNLDKIQKMM